VRSRIALVVALVLLSVPTGAQTKPTYSALIPAFDAGNYDIVADTLRTPEDFRVFMKSSDNLRAITILSGPDPKRALFWMDMAIAASTLSPGSDVAQMLSMGRSLARMGSGERLQAFERLWHETGLALLQRIKRPDLQQKYLDSLEPRYLIKFDSVSADQPFGRFVLDRAIATEQMCWLAEFPVKRETQGNVTKTVMVVTPRLTTGNSPKDLSTLPATCRTAVSQFDRAAEFPDVAAEASIRGAVSRFRLGKYDESLTALDRAKVDGTDPIRDYWGALVAARTLHQVKRLPDAEKAYRAAWALWPEARAPGTGLALVLFDLNRRDEALAITEAVYALPVASIDPWWAYTTADARFVRAWRDQLLAMAR
jgi:hypothetical protein